MRRITFPDPSKEPCKTCKGEGTLSTGDVKVITCPACQGKKKQRRAEPDEIVFFALKPKTGEQGLTRDQMRIRGPVMKAVDEMDEVIRQVTLQDDQWKHLIKCIDEREDWPFGLDVDAILTAIEDAERVEAAEITELNRTDKRRLRNK